MRRMLAIAISLLALRAEADTLGDLKAALGRLSARQPVRATYATDISVKASGKYANETSSRTATAEVAHDASGVTITIAQALIEKAHGGAAPDDAAQSEISSIRSMNVVEALDFRESLLRMLNYGAVVEEKHVAFRGRPARLLVLKLNVPRQKRNSITIGSVKVDEDRLSLWIGDGGVPLAAERMQKTTAGFLMFHADTANSTSFTFAQAGDRLILARLETRANGSALGQKIDESSVQTMTVH
jgi:hypothetical protein